MGGSSGLGSTETEGVIPQFNEDAYLQRVELYTSATTHPDKPKTYQEAGQSPDAKQWMDAMIEEVNTLESHGTWEEVK